MVRVLVGGGGGSVVGFMYDMDGCEWSGVNSSENLQRGREEGVNEERRKEKKTYLGCSG